MDDFYCTSCTPAVNITPPNHASTTDRTPTINLTTNKSSTCGVSNTNGSFQECSTTGDKAHICTLPESHQLDVGYPVYDYVNCTASGNSGYERLSFNITGSFEKDVDFKVVNMSYATKFRASYRGEVWAEKYVNVSQGTIILNENYTLAVGSSCSKGSIRWNDHYLYICNSSSTWARVKIGED